jgi:putative oxidoreductase
MKYIVLLGRVLFSIIFINSGFHHFSKSAVDYANSQNVPMADILVPFSGILAILGGISIVLGYKARIGAWLIIAFLIPVTIMMHGFWHFNDPAEQQVQISMFLKNTSMLGAAFLIAWFGAGPLSFDERNDVKKEEPYKESSRQIKREKVEL